MALRLKRKSKLTLAAWEGNPLTGQVDYTLVLADLENQRDEIERAIATIRRLANMPPSPLASSNGTPLGAPSQATLRRDQFFGMKAPEASKAYLAAVKQPSSAAKIAEQLVAHGFTSSADRPADIVRTALRRLKRSGAVVQIKKEWGLAEWYPGLRNKRGAQEEEGAEADVEAEVAPKVTSKGPRRAKRTTGYRAFLSARMKAGVSMKEAAAEWRRMRQAATGDA